MLTELNTTILSGNETYIEKQENIVYGIAIPIISIIGIIFNILILLILRLRKYFTESTYIYLFDLALADSLSLFFLSSNSFGKAYYPENYHWRIYESFFYFPFGSMVSNASIFFTVTVTIERFIFIYHPLKSKIYCTQPVAIKVTRSLWIVSILFNLPRFFVMVPDGDGELGFTAFGTSLAYKIIVWMYFLVTSAGASLILIAFNILLIRAIHRRRKRKSRSLRDSYNVLNFSAVKSGKKDEVEKEEELKDSTKTYEENENFSLNKLPMLKKKTPVEKLKDLKLENSKSSSLNSCKSYNKKKQQQFKDDFTLTLTLIVVVVVFLIGEIPSALSSRNTVVPFMGEKVLEEDWYRKALMASTLLVVNQHSTNFIVYCALNNKFCSVTKKIAKKCRRKI